MRSISEIYDQYVSNVYNIALHYVHSIPDAEEITQDVFLKVNDNIEKFEDRSMLSTWIHRITINTSLDFLRKQNAKKRSFVLSMESAVLPAHTDHSHPGIELEDKESLAELMKLINKLPNNQKTAIILHKIEGLSQKETAEIMKRSEKSVESLIGRARKSISEKLNKSEG